MNCVICNFCGNEKFHFFLFYSLSELCDVEYPEGYLLETTLTSKDDLKKKGGDDDGNRSNSGEKRNLDAAETSAPSSKKQKVDASES